MQVKAVIEQLGKSELKPDGTILRKNIDWEQVDNHVLEHFKTLQSKEIANKRRFLTDQEYKIETGKDFVEGADPRYYKGTHKGKDGIFARDKLGIQLQDELLEGMTLRNKYDNGGCDTGENERLNIFNAAKAELLVAKAGTQGESSAPSSSQTRGAAATPTKAQGRGAAAGADDGAAEEQAADKKKPGEQNDEGGGEEEEEAAQNGKRRKGAKAKAKAGQSKAKAKPKGRPPKSILADARDLCEGFLAVDMNHQLWWGSECKTQLKKIKELKKTFEQRIASAPDEDIIATFEPHNKKLGVLALLLEAHQKTGFDSAQFVECYDCCLTALRTGHVL